jgi:hypothetical protein
VGVHAGACAAWAVGTAIGGRGVVELSDVVALVRQPLKLALADWTGGKAGKRYPRTVWAERFVLVYGLAVLAALTLSVWSAQAPFWLPLLLAAVAA